MYQPIYVIDRNIFLHVISNSRLPSLLSHIAKYFLNAILQNRAEEVNVLFDEYVEPSLNNEERDHRAAQIRLLTKLQVTHKKHKDTQF